MSAVISKGQGQFLGPLADYLGKVLRDSVIGDGSETAASHYISLNSIKKPDGIAYNNFTKDLDKHIRERWYGAFSTSGAVNDENALDNLRWFFKELVATAKGNGKLGYGKDSVLEAKISYKCLTECKTYGEEMPTNVLVVPIMSSGLGSGAGVFAALEKLDKKPKYAFLSYSHVGGRRLAEDKIYIPKEDLEVLKQHQGPILLVDDFESSGLTLKVLVTFMRDMGKKDLYKFIEFSSQARGKQQIPDKIPDDYAKKKGILSKNLYRRALRT